MTVSDGTAVNIVIYGLMVLHKNFANGLTSGYVYVEVLDSNNCSVFDSVFIQQPQEISLLETISIPSYVMPFPMRQFQL